MRIDPCLPTAGPDSQTASETNESSGRKTDVTDKVKQTSQGQLSLNETPRSPTQMPIKAKPADPTFTPSTEVKESTTKLSKQLPSVLPGYMRVPLKATWEERKRQREEENSSTTEEQESKKIIMDSIEIKPSETEDMEDVSISSSENPKPK